MTWNYRVVRIIHVHPDGTRESDYGIHEAFYTDDQSTPSSITVNQIAPYGETKGELRECLAMMLKALDKPVLDYDTRKEVEP